MHRCIRLLAISIASVLIGIGSAWAVEPGGVAFATLDGDEQQVEIGEIWRVRGSAGRDEPEGAVVIDYAFERLYVKGPLDSVIGKLREKGKIERFTLPGGGPVYIVADKVISVARTIPGQHHPNSKALIVVREGQQQVQESRETIRSALGK
jgi:hypothetical protein